MRDSGQLTKVRWYVSRRQLYNLYFVYLLFWIGGWQARELYLLGDEGWLDQPKSVIDKALIVC